MPLAPRPTTGGAPASGDRRVRGGQSPDGAADEREHEREHERLPHDRPHRGDVGLREPQGHGEARDAARDGERRRHDRAERAARPGSFGNRPPASRPARNSSTTATIVPAPRAT